MLNSTESFRDSGWLSSTELEDVEREREGNPFLGKDAGLGRAMSEDLNGDVEDKWAFQLRWQS